MNTILLLLLPLGVFADENYNFYFQKAPGPTTVVQGASGKPATGSESAPSTPTPAPASAATMPVAEDTLAPATAAALVPGPTPAAPPASASSSAEAAWPEIPRRYTVSLGVQLISGGKGIETLDLKEPMSGLYRQQTLSLEADVWDRFALFGDLYLNPRTIAVPYIYDLARDRRGGVSDAVAAYSQNIEVKQGKLNVGGGMAFHLLRFGHPRWADASLSVLVGAMTTQRANYIVGEGAAYLENGALKTETALFTGARARLMAGNTLGVEASYRLFPTMKNNSLRFATTYAF